MQLGYGAFMSLAHLVWFALVACAVWMLMGVLVMRKMINFNI